MTNRAKFHSTCRYKFNNTELKRKAAFDSKQKDTLTDFNIADVDINKPDYTGIPKKLPRRQSAGEEQNICIFCEKKASLSELRQASTFKLNAKLRECAAKLRLSAGDVISTEEKYHPECLVKLYRKTEF